MSFGERAAIEGILSDLKPDTAVEIGTAAGGSLRSASTHSGHVHSFDLKLPDDVDRYTNVTFHQGDSHATLRPWLDEFEGSIQYVLIDGDHSISGALADIRAVVEHQAVDGIVLVHDACNPQVHQALTRFPWEEHERVRYVDFGFVPGWLLRQGQFRGQLWGGLAMAIVGEPVDVEPGLNSRLPFVDAYYDPHYVMRPAAEVVGRSLDLSHRARRSLGRIRRLATRWA